MIGPGTGIAPFRAFLEEREARNAPGRNWLFFGDQHEHCDFLYADQLRAWQSSGLLDRLDLAWSRDGETKCYVQHLLAREGATVFEWLESGAAVYVCGDATRMAVDVERTLLDLIATHGERTEEEACSYLEGLKQDRRYQRDVY
jgi:sulfite reductase (NADPH) flavoprotein alpha-component